jgi:tryptophan halogenase
MPEPIRKIVIVGGGTAGWMAAAPLAQRLGGTCAIELVESNDIATVGVGEATLPTIRYYNHALGVDPADFIKKTQATFKLGIAFRDWGHVGNRFFHGFGDYGPRIDNRSPHHYWLRLRSLGETFALEDMSMSCAMARRNVFAEPKGDRPSPLNAFSYAFHFDAGLYAAYLRDYAIKRGVTRTEGRIVDVALRPEDGFISHLTLADGRRVEGDLFVDCSGFRGLLIEGAMQAGFEDWSRFLPVNTALAVPSRRVSPLTPYTSCTAHAAGWQWRIPLQSRTGNGHVFCDAFMSEDEAARVLMQHLDAEALDAPRAIRFATGRRKRAWVKNCVAVGLSTGFIEPLESTSIQLIEIGVGSLIELFPDAGFAPCLAAEYNRRAAGWYENLRDFIVLHYKLTERDDSEFWRYCRHMEIPDQLRAQIDTFRTTGRVVIHDKEAFTEPSWLALYFGLGLMPQAYDPFADRLEIAAVRTHFERIRDSVARAAAGMADAGAYIDSHLKADPIG